MFAAFKFNAAHQLQRAWFLHLLLLFTNILTTVISLILLDTHCDEWSFPVNRTILMFVLPLLPVISGVIITMNTRFAPLLKWSALESGATKIKSEIYMYRARVGEYFPRVRNDIDIMVK